MIKKTLLFIIVGCILSGITGCGQTGALYLPSEEQQHNQTTTQS